MAEPSNYGRVGEDEEEDEEIDETGYKTIKDAVLFAVDVSSSMLSKPPAIDAKGADKDTPTVAALKCAYLLMQQRIISNPHDMMGILLFGTEKSRFQGEDEHSRGGLTYPHCYLLTALDMPAAADVKRLRSLVEDEDDSAQLLVASGEQVSMANVLFCANQIFATKAPNFSSRRLFLVTDNDNPHASDKAARSAAAVRAKDLYDLGVIIELFPISRPDHGFNRAVFYDDIIYSTTPADPDAPAPITKASEASASSDGLTLLQSLLSNINSKSAPRRALFSNLAFEIAPGLKISVKGFIIIKRQEPVRTSYVYLNGEKAQIAIGSSSLLAEDTARTVEKVEVRKAFKFGGETISFSKEEMSAIRDFGEPVLRVIGFKPISMLPSWASVNKCTFIYPSEEEIIGSTRVFSALQQKLLKDQKMGVAWYIPRRNATPVLAAILPGAEHVEVDGKQITILPGDDRPTGDSTQVMPPGLWIHPLPYADDVRSPPDTTMVRSPDSLVDSMRTIISQIQLPGGIYNPKKYPNPSLQWFYRILQALALEEDLPEKPEDKTIPRYKQIHKRVGPYVEEWGNQLELEFAAWKKANQAKQPGSKRDAAHGEGHALAKRPKTASSAIPSDELTDGQMRALYEKNTVGKLTITELKSWLNTRNVKTYNLKKLELVNLVSEYFDRK
ncbi:ATP-dependent DNA helicase II subunit 1 [Elasticomyces elasticus]|nr:ATP-dependent DNA helicase II subunit 1 [Elasticomyces elasticus]